MTTENLAKLHPNWHWCTYYFLFGNSTEMYTIHIRIISSLIHLHDRMTDTITKKKQKGKEKKQLTVRLNGGVVVVILYFLSIFLSFSLPFGCRSSKQPMHALTHSLNIGKLYICVFYTFTATRTSHYSFNEIFRKFAFFCIKNFCWKILTFGITNLVLYA